MAAILGVQRNLYFISFAANISFITIWMGKILSWHKHSLNKLENEVGAGSVTERLMLKTNLENA